MGPDSPSCGGPVIAGSADGPCAAMQGGLGLFQLDAGTWADTLARHGDAILTVEGNTAQAVSFVIDQVVRDIPGATGWLAAADWIARTPDVPVLGDRRRGRLRRRMEREAPMSRIYNYTVYANIHWLNTGLSLNGTAEVAIAAVGGQWTANPGTGMVGADGNADFLAKDGYALPGAAEGLLVGYVGTTPPPPNAAPPGVFAIGQGTTLPAGSQGVLYLAINDDIPALYGMGFTDNEGTIQVKVTVG